MNPSPNYRHIVFFYLLIGFIFVLASAGITTYSLGYRYNFSKHQIVKTGILRLSPTNPEYQINIDGEPISPSIVKNTTEIPNLLPGTYQIDITSDQSLPWSKKITIQPNRITNETNILIIPSQIEINDLAITKNYTSNPSQNLLAFINIDKIQILNINTQQVTTYPDIPLTNDNQLKWLSDQMLSIISRHENDIQLHTINYSNSNIASTSLTNIDFDQLLAYYSFQPNIILYQKNDQIWQLDLTSNNQPIPIATSTTTPTLIDNTLFYTIATDLGTTINSINLTYNYNLEYKFDHIFTQYFVSRPIKYIFTKPDKNNYRLSFLDSNAGTSTQNLTLDIKDIQSYQNYILAKTDNELTLINTHNFPDISSQTILRLSKKIHQSWWLNAQNIIYTTDNELYRIDIDGDNNQLIFSNPSGNIELVGISGRNITIINNSNNQKLIQNISLPTSSIN
ncbi:MAG: hypothetical protein WC570_02300 [Patescibacteria group bacterium]